MERKARIKKGGMKITSPTEEEEIKTRVVSVKKVNKEVLCVLKINLCGPAETRPDFKIRGDKKEKKRLEFKT